MTRDDFRQLARLRQSEAEALAAVNQHVGALYLAGYAVECSLKSAIITRLQSSDEWMPSTFSKECWSHKLADLIRLAGLHNTIRADRAVSVNWPIVASGWSEEVRYDSTLDPLRAREIYQAIVDPNEGVLQWIQARW